MINILQLYQDNTIPYQLPGHKHVRTGWVGTPCPFCQGHFGYHLGYCADPKSKYAGRFVCYRCGGKSEKKVLSRLLSIPEENVWALTLKYRKQSDSRLEDSLFKKKERNSIGREVKLPVGTKKLLSRHKKYLRGRSFDSALLERSYGLKGTGPIGPYKHRIIAPVYFRGKLVSYQGRDITGKSGMKYKACRQDEELRDHKHCLYGMDTVVGKSVVVVEGITDVWRLGAGAVATFGIKYTSAQVVLLQEFDNVFILFDPEEQAQEQARKLSQELLGGGRHVEIIDFQGETDPGDMSVLDARYLMKDLIGG